MLYYGGMRQVSESKRTETGERMSWPTADDTFNAGIQLGEAAAAAPPGASSIDPNFAKVYWDAYKFSSQPVIVPNELIQDSAFALAKVLGEMFGIRLGRITNTKFTKGTGAATCMGLITKCTSTAQDPANNYPTGYSYGWLKSMNAGKVVYDDIVTLEHSVDKAFRVNPSFMCHDQFLLYVRLMKDGIGRPLWQNNIRDGMPDTLDGYPLTTNNDFDNTVASGKNVLSFGDHSKYKIRTVGQIRFYRLEERYRDTDEDGFLALAREDGNLLLAGNYPVKVLQVA
jgi:HK97 family phage major capsid protein